jgi:hypothetical protein
MGELTVFASLGLTVTPLNNKAAWIVLLSALAFGPHNSYFRFLTTVMKLTAGTFRQILATVPSRIKIFYYYSVTCHFCPVLCL